MNSFVKDMLMAQSSRGRDGRNPYGSRGGYVTSRSPRRDRGMDYGMPKGDYRRGAMPPMRDYGMRRDYPEMRDYDDYGYDNDYRMYDDYAMNDYGKSEYGKLSHEDIEKWKKHLENQDGTKGEHFKKEHITQAARQIGVNPEEYGNEHIFGLVMNMMYADYCGVARKFGLDRPDFYAELAKAFLNDKDFEGEPEEKVWLYYQCIAAPEQE